MSGGWLVMIGENIKNIREGKSYTQKQFAKALNITSSCISKYETGRSQPSIDTLIEMSKLLDVSLDYLVGRNNLSFDYELLSKDYVKDIDCFDLLNMLLQLNSENRNLIVDILDAVMYKNNIQKIKKPNK